MKSPLRSRRNRRLLAVTLVIAALLCAYGSRSSLLAAAGAWLNVGTPLVERVDGVMVLGGDASTRPFVAAAVVRAGLAAEVLVARTAEASEPGESQSRPHHELIRQVLIRSGVSPQAIRLLPTTVDSTEQEARCLADFLEAHPGYQVAVVTGDFHTRRARLIFRRICRTRAADIQFIGAPTDRFDSSNWWQFESGFVYYVNEYLKLAQALVR